MFKTYISKDLWLVQLLGGAALAAVLYFNIVPGAVSENLGLVQPVAETQVAQVVSTTDATTIVVSNLKELITAMGAAKGGETIRLKPGVYDWFKATPYSITTKDSTISAVKPSNTSLVTITSDDPNNRAVLRGMEITVPYFAFVGLSFRIPKGGAAFTMYGAAHHMKIIGNDIASENAADIENWTKDDWLNKLGGSFMGNTGPTDSEIAYNNVRYIPFGILAGAGTHVHDNKIVHTSGDVSRVWGPGTVVENNYFANNYLVNENHNDFLQSWVISPATSVGSVTIRNNSFIGIDAEASTMNVSMSSLADSQGIGLFDGPYDNWVVENNLVVVTRQWHGISMYGGINSTIRHNLVADAIYSDTYGPAWLGLFDRKNGTPSTNTNVTDNYATSYTIANATTNTGNIKVLGTDYPKYFKDAAKYDWTIVPGSLPFSVGANLDTSKLAPEPYKDIVTPMDTTTVIPTNNTQGGVVTGGGTGTTPTPTLTLTVAPTTLTTGNTATLTWSSTNATACSASGSWSGSKATSGTESTTASNVAGTQTYTLTCTGAGGTATQVATLTVSAPTIVDTDKDGVADTSDNCPTTANADQKDTDADGAGDACDSTPNGTPTTTTISIGSRITTTDAIRVRSASGLASKTYGIQKAGAVGTVTAGPVTLDNYTWWNVNFDSGKDGWVAGAYVKGI